MKCTQELQKRNLIRDNGKLRQRHQVTGQAGKMPSPVTTASSNSLFASSVEKDKKWQLYNNLKLPLKWFNIIKILYSNSFYVFIKNIIERKMHQGLNLEDNGFGSCIRCSVTYANGTKTEPYLFNLSDIFAVEFRNSNIT